MLTLPALLLVVLAGCLQLQGCSALRCHICNSVSTDSCGNPASLQSVDCATWCSNQGGWLTTTSTTTTSTTPTIASPPSSSSFSSNSSVNSTDYSPDPVSAFVACPDPDRFTRCRKVVQTVASKMYEGEELKLISRSCGWTDESNGEDKEVVMKSGTTKTLKREIYTCRKDDCNSALSSHIVESIYYVVLFLAAAALC